MVLTRARKRAIESQHPAPNKRSIDGRYPLLDISLIDPTQGSNLT